MNESYLAVYEKFHSLTCDALEALGFDALVTFAVAEGMMPAYGFQTFVQDATLMAWIACMKNKRSPLEVSPNALAARMYEQTVKLYAEISEKNATDNKTPVVYN